MGNKYGYEYIWIYIRKKSHVPRTDLCKLIPAPGPGSPAPLDGSVTNLLLSYGHHSYVRNSKDK